jgi:hypothetical protein
MGVPAIANCYENELPSRRPTVTLPGLSNNETIRLYEEVNYVYKVLSDLTFQKSGNAAKCAPIDLFSVCVSIHG